MKGWWLLAAAVLAVAAVAPVEAETLWQLSYTVYGDGYTQVQALYLANATAVEINITLLSQSPEMLLATNEEGLPLQYSQEGGSATIYTLGSTQVNLTYFTQGFTSKEGATWSFKAPTPIPCRVRFPPGSVILYLNTTPLEIGLEGESPWILLPPGGAHVEYTWSLGDPGEAAAQALGEAEKALEEAEGEGVVVQGAVELLEEAWSLHAEGRFAEAEQLAGMVVLLVEEAALSKAGAEAKLSLAEEAVETAYQAGKTSNLEEADRLVSEAEAALLEGRYGEAEALARQALELALTSEEPLGGLHPLLPLGLLGAAALVAVAVAAWRLRGGDRAPTRVEVDLERLFQEHPELRVDDRMVLEFLAENDGEAFAYDIRERFDIPRTSAWRMIKRLQRFGVVDERKVGGQSLVSISKEYMRRGSRVGTGVPRRPSNTAGG